MKAVASAASGLAFAAGLLLAGGAAPPAAYGAKISWVQPFMGTDVGAPDFGNGGGSGGFYPGATLPFGMTAFSPDTIPTTGNFAGGYTYTDRLIRGFSLTHFSGGGCAGFQDVPILPTTAPMKLSPAIAGSSDLQPSFIPRFDHRHERAAPGNYEVTLNPGSAHPIRSQLTATTRTADARFTFPATRQASILVNAGGSAMADFAANADIDPSAREISGSSQSGRFCFQPNTRYRVFFVARFNRPFTAHGTWHDQALATGSDRTGDTSPNAFNYKPIPGGPKFLSGDPSTGVQVGAYVTFSTRHQPAVEMRVGISYTSVAEARRNLDAETKGRSFGDLQRRAAHAWRDQLAKVQVRGGSRRDRTVFYTSLYHALLEPNTFSDADGHYLGMDGKRHVAQGVTKYANISGWDIYRSQAQLLAMLEPKRASDLATSLLTDAQQSGCLPRWPYANQQTNIQVGDPSAAIISDVHAFGARDFNTARALRTIVADATKPCHTTNGDYTEREGLTQYLRLGFVPQELNTDVAGHTIGMRNDAWGSAATTLEDATADFTVAQLAQRLGDRATGRTFTQRAANWRKLYNRATEFIEPRFSDGTWLTSFDPTSIDGFVEGNAAQYTWAVPQDVHGLASAMGGRHQALHRLDRFFRELNAGPAKPYAYLGNEPTINTPWLYDWLGQPYKTQAVIRRAMLRLYAPTPFGMPGNDDGGTMSAWWVFSALGLYPAVPGTDTLVLTSPLFRTALLRLPRGRLIIRAAGAAEGRPYIQSARADHQALNRTWLSFRSLRQGDHRLTFRLGARPNRIWGSKATAAPPSLSSSRTHGIH